MENRCIVPRCDNEIVRQHLCTKHYRISFRYNISAEQVAVIYANPICQVCGSGKGVSMDHDHTCCNDRQTCGKCNRGLLCHKCNVAIGMLDENADWFILLADHLKNGNSSLAFRPRVKILKSSLACITPTEKCHGKTIAGLCKYHYYHKKYMKNKEGKMGLNRWTNTSIV